MILGALELVSRFICLHRSLEKLEASGHDDDIRVTQCRNTARIEITCATRHSRSVSPFIDNDNRRWTETTNSTSPC